MSGNCHRKPWSKMDGKRALRLSRIGKTEAEIAAALGRTESAVRNWFYSRAIGPAKLAEYRSNRTPQIKIPASPANVGLETVVNRPTPEMLRARDVRATLPYRDLTAAFFGDPPLGLSALDGRH